METSNKDTVLSVLRTILQNIERNGSAAIGRDGFAHEGIKNAERIVDKSPSLFDKIPVVIVKSLTTNDFQDKCNKLISEGYVIHSSNCACTGECQDEMYQAIMVLSEKV